MTIAKVVGVPVASLTDLNDEVARAVANSFNLMEVVRPRSAPKEITVRVGGAEAGAKR